MPNIVRVPGQGSVSTGSLFNCCPCINLGFLKTTDGIVKIIEAVGGSVCQTLLISHEFAFSRFTLGSSYYSFLTTSSACMMTAFVLLITYVVAQQSLNTVRKSYFVCTVLNETLGAQGILSNKEEILFNIFGAFLYLTSSCYLAVAVHTVLYPLHKLTSMFQIFPTMSGTYVVGFVLSAVHAYDAYLVYRMLD